MILANTNLSDAQSTFLLTSLVLLAIIILTSFFLMIYNFSKNANKKVLSCFWLITFLSCLTIFILIIFIFKAALDSFPCPLYISTSVDSPQQRDSIAKAINILQHANVRSPESI